VIVLALDTAAGGCTAALLDGEELIVELAGDGGQGPVRRLMPLIADLLERAGLRFSQVDLMAVSRGPGSFTGLRVGMATAQGLALATDKPVVAVSTLEALALQAGVDADVVALLDARRGEVYSAVYRIAAGDPTILAPESALAPRAAVGRCDGPCILIGSGVRAHEATLREELVGDRAVFAAAHLHDLRAASVGRLALRRAETAVAAADLVPRYLRGADAKPAHARR
jgi:tRNA threonylcarbamoyladenosine biosynthesis protein TsaB